jgi:hypothetical protein
MMRLVLSHYLSTLRERDEFDRLLPELLLSMGYVPLSKPKVGIRQFGVDFAAVGACPDDGESEMLLFVIKQGSIGRGEWAGAEPADIRPSLEEVLDTYLQSHVPSEYASLRKVIVVAITGELKQDVVPNWTGFVSRNGDKAGFRLWHGDKVAALLEEHLLNETLFADEDRQDLRKVLALCADRDYAFADLLRLLQRQLGLDDDGGLKADVGNERDLKKAVVRVALATQVCSHWAQSEGDSKQALWIAERAMLWTWHRIQLVDVEGRKKLLEEFSSLWATYQQAAEHYFRVVHEHFTVRDGMSGYSRENAEYSLVLFEHIGLLATIGLCQVTSASHTASVAEKKKREAETIAEVLISLLANHSATASPRLDRHVIDITLALILLVAVGRVEDADAWLEDLCYRLHFSFLRKRAFPVCTDSLDDLVELEVVSDDELVDRLMSTSWMLSTLAAWCALRGLDEPYSVLSKGSQEDYSNVCAQLWHPTPDWPQHWYFTQAQADSGDTEAPYVLPANPNDLRTRVEEFGKLDQYNWLKKSHTTEFGLWPLDFIACRHFKIPVPASFWYGLAQMRQSDVVDSDPLIVSSTTPDPRLEA